MTPPSPTSAARAAIDPPLIAGDPSFEQVTERISSIPETEIKKTPVGWYLSFGAALSVLMVLFGLIGHLVWEGIGVWGLQNSVGWGWAIVNFVFWVGIGHAGTLISAILFLLRQRWRTSINRFAEAMTIFAVMCALLFPGIHIGRAWMAYFLAPVPNSMGLWPNFRSPLLWDFFAVGTYFIVSLLFWYVGMIPDLATLRDRATSKVRRMIFGVVSLGWRGGNRQWRHYEMAYLLLAGLSTPLVLSVHSVVSTDFATSILPGWHSTIFPPYFVAGAIFSGLAMVVTLAIVARRIYHLEDFITDRHLELMSKLMLATGSMVGFAYTIEFFIAWYSGNGYELFTFINRATGPYAWAYWIMVTCNLLVPQIFWIKKLRRNMAVLFVATILINVGMWFERFVIVVTSLAQTFLPATWHYFTPTIFDIGLLVGSFGLFFTLFLLFIRFLPMIAMSEVKAVLPQANVPHHGHQAPDHKRGGTA